MPCGHRGSPPKPSSLPSGELRHWFFGADGASPTAANHGSCAMRKASPSIALVRDSEGRKSAARLGRIPGRAAMNKRCGPAPARSILRFRRCGARPSRRRSSSVTAGGRVRSRKALIEIYLAGISVRRVEDITEALWGARVSPSTVSNPNKRIYAKIEAWRNRRIEGR